MEERAKLVPSTSAVSIALSVQFAAGAELGGRHHVFAVWLAALGVAWFVWQWGRKRSRVALVFLNAVLLTIPLPHGFGGNSVEGSETTSSEATEDTKSGSGTAAIVADNTFPGVILFPEVQQHATLVPPLPMMRQNLFGPQSRNPLDIPFFGSYWLYKWPQRTLPKNAKVLSGNPDEKTFRSTDSAAMGMEAHENLGTLIDLRCCRAIEIVIRNADRYPHSVSVDLQLVNTTLPGKPSLSLGTLPVISAPAWHHGPMRPMIETLTYPIPDSPTLSSFDEFTVKFVLGGLRRDHSAGIAIQRFTLAPRVD